MTQTLLRNAWLRKLLPLAMALVFGRGMPPVFAIEYSGPVPPIESGFGAAGTATVAMIVYPSPLYPENNVWIFHPETFSEPLPTFFYSHPYGAQSPSNHMHLMEHIARRGNVAVFSPFNKDGTTLRVQYDILFEGFRSAATNYPGLIDTNRVGFLGFSQGGGATPEMARRGIAESGWGSEGVFLFIMAPWYALQISQQALANDFSAAKLLMLVFSEDRINDHRMAIDIFNQIGIPKSEKDFATVYSTITPDYTYKTEHNLPTKNPYDAYDCYAVFRLLDALAEYAFSGCLSAKKVALGNGIDEQVHMGAHDDVVLTPLAVTDTPIPMYPEDLYLFPWSSLTNPRRTAPMTGMTYRAWCDTHGIPAGQDGPADDPYGDGRPNLLKYTMGLAPQGGPVGGHIVAGLTKLGSNSDHPHIEFDRFIPGSAQILLEASEDLPDPASWKGILYGMETIGVSGPDTERVRLVGTEPWLSERVFLRLRMVPIRE